VLLATGTSGRWADAEAEPVLGVGEGELVEGRRSSV
jgi:hypothetical protein